MGNIPYIWSTSIPSDIPQDMHPTQDTIYPLRRPFLYPWDAYPVWYMPLCMIYHIGCSTEIMMPMSHPVGYHVGYRAVISSKRESIIIMLIEPTADVFETI